MKKKIKQNKQSSGKNQDSVPPDLYEASVTHESIELLNYNGKNCKNDDKYDYDKCKNDYIHKVY